MNLIDINKDYYCNEAIIAQQLLAFIDDNGYDGKRAQSLAKKFINGPEQKTSFADAMLTNYKLASPQGRSLLEVAEALLRIPDNKTAMALLSDKLTRINWHGTDKTWGSRLLGALMNTAAGLLSSPLKQITAPIILFTTKRMMDILSDKFVLAQEIKFIQDTGELYSFDMLGESAITHSDANAYYNKYYEAIKAIGEHADKNAYVHDNNGISVKLSALYPRYEVSHRQDAIKSLTKSLGQLCELAVHYNIPLNIDAEESWRLIMSLEIFENLYKNKSIQQWQGLGLVVQAYQKRAPAVIDWIINIGQCYNCRIPVRLVKGAYWDMEIKNAQENNLPDFPVYTIKPLTDVSFIVCMHKMVENHKHIYSQFASHNALSISQAIDLAQNKCDFELQRLFGMGKNLTNGVNQQFPNIKTRIYAPIGHHDDLLPYLVRRLLENGANSSFIHELGDSNCDIKELLADPRKKIKQHKTLRNEVITMPKNLYKTHINSKNIDLTDESQQKMLINHINDYRFIQHNEKEHQVICPYDFHKIVDNVTYNNNEEIPEIIAKAKQGFVQWSQVDVEARAAIIEKAAQLLEENMEDLVALCCHEAGKVMSDAISEVREAVDFCRYYGYIARDMFKVKQMAGPVGEDNTLQFVPKGVFMCISPWNFPLAIFMGQVVAALITGNSVIAKPALQTPLIAKKAVDILHQAGVPLGALQLIIGSGRNLASPILCNEGIIGVAFTGSTATAKTININLAQKEGPINTLIAETGGQNAMIIDSSALLEQSVTDLIHSSFQSAGQRCSAVRVCYIHTDVYDGFCDMLKGAMACLKVGASNLMDTDVGPVIDNNSQQILNEHKDYLHKKGAQLIFECAVDHSLLQKGHFVAPAVFAINDISILQTEVFGPILHIVRYKNIETAIDEINSTGFGLTFGIHTRIDDKSKHVADKIKAGNIYINRNTIGAIVGAQPFGGQGLSGTGPKAGGPFYLHRFAYEKTISIDTTAQGGNASLLAQV